MQSITYCISNLISFVTVVLGWKSINVDLLDEFKSQSRPALVLYLSGLNPLKSWSFLGLNKHWFWSRLGLVLLSTPKSLVLFIVNTLILVLTLCRFR